MKTPSLSTRLSKMAIKTFLKQVVRKSQPTAVLLWTTFRSSAIFGHVDRGYPLCEHTELYRWTGQLTPDWVRRPALVRWIDPFRQDHPQTDLWHVTRRGHVWSDATVLVRSLTMRQGRRRCECE